MPQGKKWQDGAKESEGHRSGRGRAGGDESSSSKANRPKSGKGSRGGGPKLPARASGRWRKHSAMSSALDTIWAKAW